MPSVASVLARVREKYAHEPEFVQTVEEVFTSLEPFVAKPPENEKFD